MKAVTVMRDILLSIIVMVAVALVLMTFLIGPVSGIKPLEWLTPKLPGVQGSVIPGTPISEVPLGQAEEVPHICGDVGGTQVCISNGTAGEEYQPTELGCEIANSIYTDFVRFGLDGNREQISPSPSQTDCGYVTGDWENYRGGCLVDAKTFTLNDTITTYPAVWDQLPTILSEKCHICNESTFDEVCINYNLRNRTVSASKFCDGQIPAGSSLKSTKFVNCYCVGGSGDTCINNPANPDAWCKKCDGYWTTAIDCGSCFKDCNNDANDFCDNGDWKDWRDYLRWVAEGGSATLVSDTAIEPNENFLNKHQKYIYGLIWNPHSNDVYKGYRLFFERIPSPSTNNTWDFIGDILSNKDSVRFNPLGEKYQEARMIVNVTVTGAEINELALRTQIAQKVFGTSDTSKIEYSGCSLNDCLSSEAYSVDAFSSTHRDPLADIKDHFKSTHNIKFKLDIKVGAGGLLNKTKTYIVSIENWFNVGVYKSTFAGSEGWEYNKIDRTINIYELP